MLTNYVPKYGYFETRLKAVPVPGYMVALWMIGFESSAEESAELCIFEIFGAEVTSKQATVGYGLHPFGDALIRDEFYKDVLEIDVTQYHVYAADWRPEHVEFFVDNNSIRTIHQSPRYPMQFMLGIYEIPSQLNAESCPDMWPKTFAVDYVRGYRLAGSAS